MTKENKSRRPFENIADEDDLPDKKIRRAPFEPIIDIEKAKEYVFSDDVLEFAHGNIFDQKPPLTPEEGEMILKRLKDEGYTYGD